MPLVIFRAFRLPPFLLYGLVVIISLISVVMLQNSSIHSTAVVSWALSGKVIVVDAGHGGFDPGVLGVSGTVEKNINLQIATVLAQLLREAGASVVMTRDADTALGNTKQEDLSARVELSGENNADIYISIHCNALGDDTRWRGAQSFFFSDNEDGRLLAHTIQKELRDILKNTDRVALRHDTTYILKNLQIPAAIIEVGFLSNEREEELLNNADYQWQVAWAIFSGIGKYFAGIFPADMGS